MLRRRTLVENARRKPRPKRGADPVRRELNEALMQLAPGDRAAAIMQGIVALINDTRNSLSRHLRVERATEA